MAGTVTAVRGGPTGTRTRTDDAGRRAVGPFNPRPHHRVAGRPVHAGVDGHDLRRRSATRSAEVNTSTGSPTRRPAATRCGDGEVDMRGRVDALQRGELGALVQVLAGVDVRDADSGLERGADRLAGDDRLGAGDLSQSQRRAAACALSTSSSGTELVWLARRARARTVSARASCASLGLQLGLLDGHVEGDQNRSRLRPLVPV